MPDMGLSSARPSRSRFVLNTLAVVTLAAVGIVIYHLLTNESAVQQPETVEVERGTVSLTASATGIVTPSQQWSLGFETDAEITTVNVTAGDQVTKGDVLAEADDTDAAALVDEAQTALEEAEDDLVDATSDADECETASAQTTETVAVPGTTAQPAQTECQSTGTDAILTSQQRVNQTEADLAAAEGALDATDITAPADATVMSVSASEGTVATVEIMLSSAEDVLFVPVAALESGEGDARVTVLADDGTEQTREVTIGLYGDAGVEIRSGLAEGDTVVLGQ
jgi:macrolide-specific efflux system membrane fusion protein